MHYEPFCELCGVSFAIARLRRVDEPEGAGWDSAGLNYILAYDSDSGLDVSALCEEGSGCRVFDRGGGRTEEHLAGPGCVAYSGYSGHRISLAEMKGCRAVQCLVKKTASWMPEDDDQDFEIEGDYFLSGIRDDLPYTTPQLEFMESSRHGVQFLAMSYIVCFSSTLRLPQSWAYDGPDRKPIPRTLFRSIPHASKYTKHFA